MILSPKRIASKRHGTSDTSERISCEGGAEDAYASVVKELREIRWFVPAVPNGVFIKKEDWEKLIEQLKKGARER